MEISFLIILYPLTFIISILFTTILHPLAIGLRLLVQTILICCSTGLINVSFWFSYILFLIFLGGILVLFIYITSLASNEIFSPSISIITFILIRMPIILLLIIITDNTILTQLNYFKIPIVFKELPYISDLSLVSIIYNSTNLNLTIFIVFYLFLTLIVVVKITNIFFGPLRLSIN